MSRFNQLEVLTEWKKGWPVLASATIGYGVGGTLFQMTAGLFIVPMRENLGWSVSAVALAPIVLLSWAIVSPFAGALIDRLGSRRVALIGASAVGGFVAMLGLLPVSPIMLYSLATLIGIATALTVVPTYGRGVATWFKSGVGLAFGITLSGSTLVATFMIPATSHIIQSEGWRMGYLGLAAVMLGIGLPTIFFGFREKPAAELSAETTAVEERPVTGLAFSQVVKDGRFWLYIATFFISCIPLGGFGSHLQPLLAYQGFALPTAISLGVALVISISIGRVVGGILLDRVWPFALGGALLITAALGAAALGHITGSGPLIIPFVVVCIIGVGQGAEADFIAFFALRSFGLKAFSTIAGIFGMVGTFGVAVGGFGFSAVYDLQGSYLTACYIAGACWVIGGLMLIGTGLFDNHMKRKVLRVA